MGCAGGGAAWRVGKFRVGDGAHSACDRLSHRADEVDGAGGDDQAAGGVMRAREGQRGGGSCATWAGMSSARAAASRSSSPAARGLSMGSSTMWWCGRAKQREIEEREQDPRHLGEVLVAQATEEERARAGLRAA